MKHTDTSVLLFSRTPSVREKVGRAVAATPHAELKAHAGSMVEMNGHAAEMAIGSDVVIFEAEAIHDDELGAIASMLKARNKGTVFVALTDDNLPIAKARLLAKAGVDEIVPVDGTEEELGQILRSSRQRRLAAPDGGSRPPGSVIAVARARGGIGATTIAINLAYLLQDRRGILKKEARHKVAIVDLELQFGDVGIFLDVEDRGAMMEIIRSDRAPDRTFVRSAVIERKCGLAVLPAPAQPVPLEALDSEKVAGLIDALRAEFDYVVVDMPQALVPWVAPVIARAQKLLIATDTTVPGVRHTRRMINAFTEETPLVPIEVVVVHERRPMFLSSDHKEAAKVLEHPLTYWLPHDGVSTAKAIDRGEPVAELHGGSELSKTMRKMAKSIARSLAAQEMVSKH